MPVCPGGTDCTSTHKPGYPLIPLLFLPVSVLRDVSLPSVSYTSSPFVSSFGHHHSIELAGGRSQMNFFDIFFSFGLDSIFWLASSPSSRTYMSLLLKISLPCSSGVSFPDLTHFQPSPLHSSVHDGILSPTALLGFPPRW